MASPEQVKKYLAYWFQLGKKVMINKGEEGILPEPVMQGDRFSAAFEDCWQRIITLQGRECYLAGTNQTIAELLSPKWTISHCARCTMPVPMIDLGLQDPNCPCSDLDTWPNNELPLPRSPINTKQHLNKIKGKLDIAGSDISYNFVSTDKRQ